jgi:hypothetical protein
MNNVKWDVKFFISLGTPLIAIAFAAGIIRAEVNAIKLAIDELKSAHEDFMTMKDLQSELKDLRHLIEMYHLRPGDFGPPRPLVLPNDGG